MQSQYYIRLANDDIISDIVLSNTNELPIPSSADKTCLEFLSIVELARIPLYLAVGSPLSVSTRCSSSEQWFRNHLTNPTREFDQKQWWECASRDSRLGILASVPPLGNSESSHDSPRITQLLFYASTYPNEHSGRELSDAAHSSGAVLTAHVLALSSDLLVQAPGPELTPPTSPHGGYATCEASFLPHAFPVEKAPVNEPPIRKRKSAVDAFDQASERYEKARRSGGGGVSAAAATKQDASKPALGHHRGNSESEFAGGQTRRLSRSPSVASSRPATASTQVARPSGLSRIQSVDSPSAAAAVDVESKNRDLVSRIVMAGMRLHGLCQSKSRKSRRTSASPMPAGELSAETLDTDQRNDEEYKLVYHQAFKGTCFAFRHTIGRQSLQVSTDAIRNVADTLLALYCSDPLAVAGEATAGGLPVIRQNAFSFAVP